MNNLNKAGSILILAATSSCLFAGEVPNTENMQGMQFNFSAPGARSLGMGGAFVGRADDATAAYANPAGLTGLYAPEISAEYRDLDYSTSYSASGEYPNIVTDEAGSGVSNLSYLSYVKADIASDFVWSVFYHQLMDFETSFSGGAITNVGLGTANPTQNLLEMDIATYGFSAAYRVSDRFSIGASIENYDFSQSGQTTRFSLNTGDATNVQVQSGSDSATGITLGAIFQLTDKLNLGFVYRSTPDFSADHTTYSDPPANSSVFHSQSYDFEIPDVYGIGFSYQPSDNLTINFDVINVNYSDIASPAFDAFGRDSGSSAGVATTILGIDDGTEFHLGAEYITASQKLALRFGAWQDPAHTIEFQGTPSNGTERFYDAMFQGGDDETHFAFGVGFIFEGKGQIDIAADFSDIQDTISISGVFRFQ